MKTDRERELESSLTLKPGEDEGVFAEDGTDLTQIRMMLELSPTERVRYIQSLARSVVRMRRGVRRVS